MTADVCFSAEAEIVTADVCFPAEAEIVTAHVRAEAFFAAEAQSKYCPAEEAL